MQQCHFTHVDGLKIGLTKCNFECHKRLWLSLLDINWFSDEIVKYLIQQMVSELELIMDSSRESITLRKELLMCNSVALLAVNGS